MPVGVMPFSRHPSDGPSKQQKRRRSPRVKPSIFAHRHTPEAGSSGQRLDFIPEHIGQEPHDVQSEYAGDDRQTYDIKPALELEHLLSRPTTPSHRLAPLPADGRSDETVQEGSEATRLTDHYLITARGFDRMQAEMTALKARIADLEQEAHQEGKGALEEENADLKKERDRYKEEAREAEKLVDGLKTKVLGLFG